MVLMGRVVDDGNVHSWLHNRQMHAPSSMVVGISVRCVAVRHSMREMCGVASPTNDMGPQNAVDVAVISPAIRKSLRFMC